MAARETFEWIVEQFLPGQDAETKEFVGAQRNYLMKIRSEDEQQRFLEALVSEIRDLKKNRLLH